MGYLGTKPANAVLTSEQIGDGVITTADLADGLITTAKIAAGAVVADDIANGAVTRAKMGYAGAVLQVVTATKSDNFSTTSTSFTDVTGLSVSITPSSTASRILVIANLFVGTTSGNFFTIGQVVRDSTALAINTGSSGGWNGWANSGSLTSGNDNRSVVHNGVTYLDSPNTTSATTYKIQVRAGNGTGYVNRWALNGDAVAVSSITVMEIAG